MMLIVGIATVVGTAASVLTVWLQARGRRINDERPRASEISIMSLHQTYTVTEVERFIEASRNLVVRLNAGTGKTATVVANYDNLLRAPSRLERIKIVLKPRWRRTSTMRSVPTWALGLMAAEDARRYAWEWGAHLQQLIEEGDSKQARRDRRRLARSAITLAIALRVGRALSRAR